MRQHDRQALPTGSVDTATDGESLDDQAGAAPTCSIAEPPCGAYEIMIAIGLKCEIIFAFQSVTG
jgi:hypothetical protein